MSEERHKPVSEDVSGEALASALPRGGARLWGCLRWFACLRAPHPLLSEQFSRISQARRWFQNSHTQTLALLRLAHHSDSFIRRLTLRLTHHSDSFIT